MLALTLDLYRTHRSEYSQPKTPRLVRVRPAHYLTITGRGEPGGDAFTRRSGRVVWCGLHDSDGTATFGAGLQDLQVGRDLVGG